MTVIGDYHIHTNFCPHGSNDLMEQYIKKALSLNLKEITFTEHAPLPVGFVDPTPNHDSAMSWNDLEEYIQTIYQLKQLYQKKLKINLGFEVDYIEGYEKQTKEFLDQYGEHIDDAILSVHMLQTPNKEYVCIDYSREMFGHIIDTFGSVDSIYEKYYQTIEKAIQCNLGKYKPKRLGHLTLIEKFHLIYPAKNNYNEKMDEILLQIETKNMELDLNSAGLFKEDCREIYPNISIINKAIKRNIPLVPGSDSHASNGLTKGFDQFPNTIPLSKPTYLD
jgi:histidinol-phosphatase (PHP family)